MNFIASSVAALAMLAVRERRYCFLRNCSATLPLWCTV